MRTKGGSKAVVVIWLTLSVASVLLAAATWFQLSHRLSEATEAAAVRFRLEEIEKLLIEVETAQRGHAITGDERFLAPLRQAEMDLPRLFQELVGLVRDDFGIGPEMLHEVLELRVDAELLLAGHLELVKLREKEGFPAVAAVVEKGELMELMNRVRTRVISMRFSRPDLISNEGAATRTQLTRASLTSLIAGVFGIGAGILAFLQAQASLRHQRRARELVEARLEAENKSREKTVLLANMSHEIRTPMNSILGFSELLDGALEGSRHRQHVKSIRASATSLLQLINDILDMSKLEAGVLELHPEPADVREFCQFLQTMFSENAARKRITLVCEVEEDLPPALVIDRIRLRQILVNLVGNAIKFTDEGGVTVRVSREQEEQRGTIALEIRVEDTGVGIPEERLGAVFRPFVQAGAHRDKENQGTGLGLSIVKRLTEIMGGTVTATSVMGKGTTFYLRFPGIPISERLPATEVLEDTAPADFALLQPSTLLVVDDNEANCRLLEAMLEDSGHRLAVGHDGREGVEKARELRPDVILMDVRMPVMDGREALVRIRQSEGLALTPVIAVAASTLKVDEEEIRSKFSGYLRKPFSQRELFAELKQFLPARALPKPGTAGGARTNGEVAGAAAEPSGPVDPALVALLEKAVEKEWPGLRDGLAINQCKAFAHRLREWARQYECEVLERYGAELGGHADGYHVIELEKELERFPALVDQLAERSRR